MMEECIYRPNSIDIILGRSAVTRTHPGNIRYRELVEAKRLKYVSAERKEKRNISVSIVNEVRNSGGRFLDQDVDGNWYDIGDDKAISKVSQALRENQPKLKERLPSDTDNDPIIEPLPLTPNIHDSPYAQLGEPQSDVETIDMDKVHRPILRRGSSFPPASFSYLDDRISRMSILSEFDNIEFDLGAIDDSRVGLRSSFSSNSKTDAKDFVRTDGLVLMKEYFMKT